LALVFERGWTTEDGFESVTGSAVVERLMVIEGIGKGKRIIREKSQRGT
jgi:hypothetical protein